VMGQPRIESRTCGLARTVVHQTWGFYITTEVYLHCTYSESTIAECRLDVDFVRIFARRFLAIRAQIRFFMSPCRNN
jgi:hypothetical protein